MLNLDCMCSQHRHGEHYEIHKFVSTVIEQKRSVDGYFTGRLIEPAVIIERHRAIADLMKDHRSPLSEGRVKRFMALLEPWQLGTTVDRRKSIADLCDRCSHCRELILYYGRAKCQQL